ncbi:hypothetical protein Zmor_022354 [Zophobas morio]|uniref:Uncharacterized protein n=1 Tax=Zophobas morio TaxID=2755281 RepID=A0AA38HV72_9CUCU|nr:hypothetical protein Zmor_022354 [Zophobas morio]
MDVSGGRPIPQRSPISNFINGEANRSLAGVNGVNQTLNGTISSTQEGPNERQSNTSGNSETDKTYFFTGTAERVIAWNRVLKHRCFYEVIATLVSVQENQDSLHSIILLKDKKGPILQVTHYFDHEMPEEQFIVGETLRCVGYMTGITTMLAVSIRAATPEETAVLKRCCYIGDFAISGLVNAEDR